MVSPANAGDPVFFTRCRSNCFLRYGVVLAPGQFSQIIADIRRGKARLIGTTGEKGSTYSVRIKEAGGRVYVLAIDRVPITAWPLKAAKRLLRNAATSPNEPT